MHDLIGPAVFHQHDKTGIGHNQGIGLHVDHRRDVAHIGVYLAVMRGNVAGDVELLTKFMRTADAMREIVEGEVVIAYTQAVARLPGVNGIGAVSKGVFHIADSARRGE